MIFTRQDHQRLDAILRAAARPEAMPRFRRLADSDIRAKQNPVDVVTEADEAAERFICAELAKAFPGAALIGEEAVTRDPSLLSKLSDAELAFVIDPIDGTLNYASDLSLFAVMAAVVVRGEIAAAVIHDPTAEDSAMALRGAGAWMGSADGTSRDLRVAPAVATRQMNGMASWRLAALLRAGIPVGRGGTPAIPALRRAQPLGPCAGRAALQRGRRPCAPAGRPALFADRAPSRPALRAR